MNIVLVHGFLNRGGIMKSLARRLAAEGHRCYTPTLKPADARGGLSALAHQLDNYIAHVLGSEERLVLVGFSMGALVCRYYLQNLGGAGRAAAFYSIAGPHAGTRAAYFYPSMGVRHMRPKSVFLSELANPSKIPASTPVVCYWTPFDLMIWPGSSARLPGALHIRIPALVHTLLLFDRRLSDDLIARLRELG